MSTRKHVTEIALYSVAMSASVGLCLWVLLGPLRIDRYLGVPQPEQTKANAAAATPVPVPVNAIVLFPGGDGRLLAQMQGALIRKGYWAGPAGADGNDNALTALEAFQGDNALPVQPKCDQQCRTALGLPDPQ